MPLTSFFAAAKTAVFMGNFAEEILKYNESSYVYNATRDKKRNLVRCQVIVDAQRTILPLTQ